MWVSVTPIVGGVLGIFPILADQRVEIKESEKTDKYLDLARELKNL